MSRRTPTANRMQAGEARWLSAIKAALVAACVVCALPATASAAVTTFGSSLSAPASMNTSENLDYKGIDTPLPGMVFHTPHFGADTALWNVGLAVGTAAAPAPGQVVRVSLEGCAQQASGGPAPLTQIHFQVLSPLPDGGAKVELTSQSFDIPVCGQGGASGSTVSTYEPINLCVNAGDYVALNDEGGYVENIYRSGVPYQVIGSAQGSTMDSFIKGQGTGNGASFSPSEVSDADGFEANPGTELMLQATLGTGPDARYVCPGGTQGADPLKNVPVRLRPQTEGLDRQHNTAVAMYCVPSTGCDGTAALTSADGRLRYGSAHFAIPGAKTSHVPIRVNHTALMQLRGHHLQITTTMTVMIGAQVMHQTVRLKGH
jgi:hypothetical protein